MQTSVLDTADERTRQAAYAFVTLTPKIFLQAVRGAESKTI